MHGAADYITKPFDTNELLSTIGKIIQLGGLREESHACEASCREKYASTNTSEAVADVSVFEKVEGRPNHRQHRADLRQKRHGARTGRQSPSTQTVRGPTSPSRP